MLVPGEVFVISIFGLLILICILKLGQYMRISKNYDLVEGRCVDRAGPEDAEAAFSAALSVVTLAMGIGIVPIGSRACTIEYEHRGMLYHRRLKLPHLMSHPFESTNIFVHPTNSARVYLEYAVKQAPFVFLLSIILLIIPPVLIVLRAAHS